MKVMLMVGLVLVVCVVSAYPVMGSRGIGDVYHSNQEVYSLLDGLPGVEKEVIGESFLGEPIYLYKLGSDGANHTFLFDGRLHGAEDCGTESGLSFLSWVLRNGSSESEYIRKNTQLLFLPIINVDTTRRQNARREAAPFGVDLNRNFDYGWGKSGSSDPLDTYQYRGAHAASEPETRAVISALQKYSPDVYMNVHCGMETLSSETDDALSQRILATIAGVSASKSTDTISYYKPRMGASVSSSGNGMARSSGYFHGASSWLFEVSTWEHLPESLNEYESTFFSRTLPVFIAMSAPGIHEVVPPPPPLEPQGSPELVLEVDVTLKDYSHSYLVYDSGRFLLQVRPYTDMTVPVFQFGLFHEGAWFPLLHSKLLPRLGKTYSLRVVVEAGSVSLWVDGILNNQVQTSLSVPQARRSFWVGDSPSGDRRFSGVISKVMVFEPHP